MRKTRFKLTRIAVVATITLLAGYAGVRTTADVTVTQFKFKGFVQQALWNVPGGQAEVFCAENVTGPGKPVGSPSALVSAPTQNWDYSTWSWSTADLQASGSIDPFGLSYTPTLNKPTSCSFTGLPGSYNTFTYYSNWNWVGAGSSTAVTVTGDSTLTAGDVQETHYISMNTDSLHQYMVKTRSQGKMGQQITGLGGIAMTDADGNVSIVVPEGTPVTDWGSFNQYTTSGDMYKYQF